MITIPENLAYLLKWETKAYAFLALVLKDGTPQVTPVWFDWDGTHLIINTARGRVKDKVLKRHPLVAAAIANPADPYEYIQLRGRVVEETEVGAREMIDHLSLKYEGVIYKWYKGETRVTYKVLVEHARGG
ncbi:MAG: pyridoxamine 5'-phosphate oxidase family protein [Anaerolineales bacterium]|nr:pyridoxamine 5'-phosphate oxidase family protein [Anaerolineales bacterium]